MNKLIFFCLLSLMIIYTQSTPCAEIKPEDFTMQTTSVFISKNKTIIEVEKKGKDDMKLISLKRNRDNPI